MTDITHDTRRAFLATAGLAACAGLASLNPALAVVDLVFSKIAVHKDAIRIFDETSVADGAKMVAAIRVEYAALLALIATVPSSRAGLVAMLDHLAEPRNVLQLSDRENVAQVMASLAAGMRLA
jgi:hypothetical protein